MVNSGPPIFSLRSSTCSFNVAKYSFILAFSILFCSHVYRSAPFNRILKSCLKQVVLCTQAPLGRCWAATARGTARADLCKTPQPRRATKWQHTVLAQLLSWPLERLCSTIGLGFFWGKGAGRGLCVCVCVFVFWKSVKTASWFAFLCYFLVVVEEPR